MWLLEAVLCNFSSDGTVSLPLDLILAISPMPKRHGWLLRQHISRLLKEPLWVWVYRLFQLADPTWDLLLHFVWNYTTQSVRLWVDGLSRLASFAITQPHASYSALTHGFMSKWTFYLRTTPGIAEFLDPLEHAIHFQLLPKLLSHAYAPCDLEQSLFAMPVHHYSSGLTHST